MGESNSNPIRFGIIGCAEIARKVARAISLSPNATLYAIASRSIDKAERFAAFFGELSGTFVEKIYGNYDHVLDDPLVDVVYLPLPTSLHMHWAILAAQKKKHLLLEKPTALDVEELDRILEACRSNGVQFMDGSMWLHHPRTAKMKDLLSDPRTFGQVNFIHSSSTLLASPQFLESNIRVQPDLDGLGALGDLGWYCIGAILWAKDYQLPNTVQALPDLTTNSQGVILSCTASFHWGHSRNTTSATIHCSFHSHTTMDLAISGPKASIHTNDFIIPYREDSASFELSRGAKFVDLHIGWNLVPEEVRVVSELPQEAFMVQELARVVEGIKKNGHEPESKWPEISRKTQLLLDAVKRSIVLGFKPVLL
ncbi:hypothetical protein UlMin_023777 [Ulmus minor]